MNETLDYIESYFEDSLTADERMQFEQRITTDAAFAGDVAFYLQARQVLRQELMVQKTKSWETATVIDTGAKLRTISVATQSVAQQAPSESSGQEKNSAPVVKMPKPSLARRITAVAAGVVITAGISVPLLFNSLNGLQRLADKTIEQEMAQIAGPMGDTEINTEVQAIEAYNTADYATAAKIFDSLQAVEPGNAEVLQYNGQTALYLKKYDSAISRFHRLAAHAELRSNPGKWYEALALIQSKKQGYKEEARVLLNEVVNGKLEGSVKAAALLEQLK